MSMIMIIMMIMIIDNNDDVVGVVFVNKFVYTTGLVANVGQGH